MSAVGSAVLEVEFDGPLDDLTFPRALHRQDERLMRLRPGQDHDEPARGHRLPHLLQEAGQFLRLCGVRLQAVGEHLAGIPVPQVHGASNRGHLAPQGRVAWLTLRLGCDRNPSTGEAGSGGTAPASRSSWQRDRLEALLDCEGGR